MALTPAQKQQAYRDRKRAIRDAPKLEAARIEQERERASLTLQDSIRHTRLALERLQREAEEQAAIEAADAARRAEEEAKARGIADGTLSPDGDPWRPGEPVKRPNTPTSAREMIEAGRKAVLQAAVDSFDRTGALAPDPDGPRRRVESVRVRDYGPWAHWHRDY